MQFTPRKLKEICDFFEIKEPNSKKLVDDFFKDYPNAELKQDDNFVSDLCLSYNGKKVLEFSRSSFTEPYDGLCRIPPAAKFYGKTFEHTFVDSNIDEIYWPGTDEYQYTETTEKHQYTERGKGKYDHKRTFSLFQAFREKTTVRYDINGDLEAIIIPDKDGLAKIKRGFPAKLTAWIKRLPLHDYSENTR